MYYFSNGKSGGVSLVCPNSGGRDLTGRTTGSSRPHARVAIVGGFLLRRGATNPTLQRRCRTSSEESVKEILRCGSTDRC
jgi:hypothetical protein